MLLKIGFSRETSVYQVVIDTASRQISVRFGDSNKVMQNASYLDPRGKPLAVISVQNLGNQ